MTRAVEAKMLIVGAGSAAARSCSAAGTLFAPALRLRPHLGRRAAEAAAEGAVEVEQVAEADIEGDRTDGTCGTLRVHEHAVRAQESLAEHELRERLALGLEQHVDV